MTVETAPWPVVTEPTTPIRPSEALRLGRLRYPRRIEGPAFDGADGACAIGAIGAGGMPLTWGIGPAWCPDPERRHWSDWFRRPPRKNCAGYDSVFGVTAHLNDNHHWNDAQIVAWLESLGL